MSEETKTAGKFIGEGQYGLPSALQVHNAVMSLRKELSDKGKDENIADINSWIMGSNFMEEHAVIIIAQQQEINTELKKQNEELVELLKNANELIEIAESGNFGSNLWSVRRSEFTEKFSKKFPQ